MTRSGRSGADRKRVLALCSIVPFPETRGDPVRIMSMLRALSRHCDLTVWCIQSNGGDAEGLCLSLGNHVAVRVFEPDGGRWLTGKSFVVRHVVAVLRGVPVWIIQRRSLDLSNALTRRAGAGESVVVFGEAAAHHLTTYSGRWHWDRVNIFCATLPRQIRETRRIRTKLSAVANYVNSLRYEAKYTALATTISVTSPAEAVRMSAKLHRVPDLVIPSSVPIPVGCLRQPEPKRLVWLGNLGYASNWNGLLRYLEDDWTSMAGRGWTLRVIGSGMTHQIREVLARRPGVRPVGFVDDLSEELSKAYAAVVPIWSGGGVKMKTLTLMAHGVPVVSTPMGLEGISDAASSAPAFVVGGSPRELNRALERGERSGELESVGEGGSALVGRQFSPRALDAHVCRLVDAV